MYYWFLFVLALVVKVVLYLGVICVITGWLPWLNYGLVRYLQPEACETSPGVQNRFPPDFVFDLFSFPYSAESKFNFAPDRIRGLITVLASLAIFVVLPLGRVSLNLSPLHSGLAEFPVLYISAPDAGLLFLGFCFFLALIGRLPGYRSAGPSAGAYRLFAQLFSLQVGFGLLLPGLVFITGTLNLLEIVIFQREHGWLIFYQPVVAVAYLGLVLFLFRREALSLGGWEPDFVTLGEAQIDRLELFSEYLLLFAFSGLFTVLFLGGGLALPVGSLQLELIAGWPGSGFIRPLIGFGLKTGLVILLLFRLRYSWPRVTHGQLLKVCWLIVLPVALVNTLLVVVMRSLLSGPSSSWVIFQVIWLLGMFYWLDTKWSVSSTSRGSVKLRG